MFFYFFHTFYKNNFTTIYLPLLIASHFGANGIELVRMGLIAIIGHSMSIFLKFKGGKGVATSLGVFLFLIPKVMVVLVAIFIVVVTITRYISLGSIVCSALLPILTYFMSISYPETKNNMILVTFVIGMFVIWRHKSNIVRIYKGEESKFSLRR